MSIIPHINIPFPDARKKTGNFVDRTFVSVNVTKSRFAQLPSLKDVNQFMYRGVKILYKTTFA